MGCCNHNLNIRTNSSQEINNQIEYFVYYINTKASEFTQALCSTNFT
jgi:hypothetical protein